MSASLTNFPSDPEKALREINGKEIDEERMSQNWQDATAGQEHLRQARKAILLLIQRDPSPDLFSALGHIGDADFDFEKIAEREVDNA